MGVEVVIIQGNRVLRDHLRGVRFEPETDIQFKGTPKEKTLPFISPLKGDIYKRRELECNQRHALDMPV